MVLPPESLVGPPVHPLKLLRKRFRHVRAAAFAALWRRRCEKYPRHVEGGVAGVGLTLDQLVKVRILLRQLKKYLQIIDK